MRIYFSTVCGFFFGRLLSVFPFSVNTLDIHIWFLIQVPPGCHYCHTCLPYTYTYQHTHEGHTPQLAPNCQCLVASPNNHLFLLHHTHSHMSFGSSGGRDGTQEHSILLPSSRCLNCCQPLAATEGCFHCHVTFPWHNNAFFSVGFPPLYSLFFTHTIVAHNTKRRSHAWFVIPRSWGRFGCSFSAAWHRHVFFALPSHCPE